MRDWISNNTQFVLYATIIGVAFLIFSYTLYRFIGIFVFSLFIYYVTRPVYNKLKKKIGHPNISATIAMTVFVFPFILIITYTSIVALQELRLLISSEHLVHLEEFIDIDIGTPETLRGEVEEIITEPGIIGSIVATGSSYASIFTTILINIFLVLLITFYALKDSKKVKKESEQIFGEDTTTIKFFKSVDKDFEILFFGNILYALFAGVIASVTYFTFSLGSPSTIDLPYPFLLGVLTGAASLIPIIGVKLVYVPISGILIVESYFAGPETYWFPILFMIFCLLLIDTIPDFIVRPYVSGERLHMGSLIFAYVFGPVIFGWYGLFLGPILLIFITNIYRIILPQFISQISSERICAGDKIVVEIDSDMQTVTVVERDGDKIYVSTQKSGKKYSVIKEVSIDDVEKIKS